MLKAYHACLILLDIYCQNNQLTSLPNLPPFLTHLYCSFNRLTSLPDLSTLTYLQYLYCDNNQLTTLPDISGSNYLSSFRFYCEKNLLDEDDCPDITATEALGLQTFTYNPQGIFYDPYLPYWPAIDILDWVYDVSFTYEQVLDCAP